MSDHYVQTKIKEVDTFNFTLGVGLTLFTQYIILAHPELFPTFFRVLLSFMMIHRFYDYQKTKFHYFMLDFCYFMQISTYMQMYSCPSSASSEMCEIWFKSNHVLSHGPIAFAVIAWKNSLVFHRYVSTYLCSEFDKRFVDDLTLRSCGLKLCLEA